MPVPYDGGDTSTIDSGGAGLQSAAKAVDGIAPGFTQAGSSAAGAAGDAEIAASLRRYSAAASAMTTAIHAQLDAAGQLARNAAADLNVAGGS